MELKLNLSSHCIETELKRLYNQYLNEYFNKDGQDSYLESMIELLINCLEKFDFSCLRSKYQNLAGGYDVNADIISDNLNNIYITVNGKTISNCRRK